MSDKKLLDISYFYMMHGRYDNAIRYCRRMSNFDISLKAELLIIEHELVNLEE